MWRHTSAYMNFTALALPPPELLSEREGEPLKRTC